jgi:SARP family transcriptional regulator, regulator of embCAB operon
MHQVNSLEDPTPAHIRGIQGTQHLSYKERSMSASPRFHITEAGRPERSVELTGTTTIGRDSDNDIVLAEITVSRCHAVLVMELDEVHLMDLDSTNGTLVNGMLAPPDESVRLMDGDVIKLGGVVVRYAARYAPGTPASST